jgi:predicted metalloprotease
MQSATTGRLARASKPNSTAPTTTQKATMCQGHGKATRQNLSLISSVPARNLAEWIVIHSLNSTTYDQETLQIFKYAIKKHHHVCL